MNATAVYSVRIIIYFFFKCLEKINRQMYYYPFTPDEKSVDAPGRE